MTTLRPNFEQAPYSPNNAITTQTHYHTFSALRHVASHHSNMAAYAANNIHTSPMNVDNGQQQREDSYTPEETSTKRQKFHHHSSPDRQHGTRTDSPTAEWPAIKDVPEGTRGLYDQFDMLPPPSSVHASWQALHDYAQSHASQHGYALSINTTAKNRSRIKLACVCYGQPKNTHKLTDETRVRKNRVSYKTGCKMWIEGKKQDDGTWLLRVGEAQHNHPGRESAGWAVQRKRTWGIEGGRIGVGGVTAKEELAKLNLSSDSKDTLEDMDAKVEVEEEVVASPQHQKSAHSLERGGLVWKIVEQEMLRKGEPNQGRDRGVGRTVEVLQARLPGIHIFKRDVYNIRAQIKRARKAAGQQLGDGLSSSSSEASARTAAAKDEMDTASPSQTPTQLPPQLPAQPSSILHRNEPFSSSSTTTTTNSRRDSRQESRSSTIATLASRRDSRIDPALIPLPPALSQAEFVEVEVDQLCRENAELRRLLTEKTNEVKEKSIEMAGLRSQIELLSNMMMTTGGRGGGGMMGMAR